MCVKGASGAPHLPSWGTKKHRANDGYARPSARTVDWVLLRYDRPGPTPLETLFFEIATSFNPTLLLATRKWACNANFSLHSVYRPRQGFWLVSVMCTAVWQTKEPHPRATRNATGLLFFFFPSTKPHRNVFDEIKYEQRGFWLCGCDGHFSLTHTHSHSENWIEAVSGESKHMWDWGMVVVFFFFLLA